MSDAARLPLPVPARPPLRSRAHAPAADRRRDIEDAQSVAAGRGIDMLLLLAPLIGATLLAKLSVPPFGERGIAVGVGIPFAIAGLALLLGRLRLAADRAVWALASTTTLFGIALLRGESFSLLSLLMYAVIHLPYAVEIADGEALRERAQRFFIGLAALIGALGALQIALQFVLPVQWAFPLENFAPKGFIVAAFNQQGPVDFGSELYRANGMVMLEPSFFSQLLAVAIVAELCGRHRKAWLALFALALVLSYSGTGLVVLALALPVLLLTRARMGLFVGTLLAVLMMAALAYALDAEVFAKRAAEIATPGSSGFARFVGGFYMWDQFLWHEPLRALFGYGAGAFDRYEKLASYPVAAMAITKMVFEFGVLGALVYFGFLAYCVLSVRAPLALKIAVGSTLVLSGNYIPFAHGLALRLLVWPSGRDTTPSPERLR